MSGVSDITAIVINYRTPYLLPIVTKSFKDFYPNTRLIIVDNGSEDESIRAIERLQEQRRAIDSLFLKRNIYHGPAVNRTLKIVKTSYFFLLDTDCRVKRGGFLEKMLEEFHNKRVYAVGKIRYVQPSGVPVTPSEQKRRHGIPYAETWGAMFDKEKCAHLGEFTEGGASGSAIARAAYEQRYRAVNFPIHHYIDHLGAGTRRMFQGSAQPRHRQKASKWSKGRRRF